MSNTSIVTRMERGFALAGALVAAAAFAEPQPAQAHWHHWHNWGGGPAIGAAFGAATNPYYPQYAPAQQYTQPQPAYTQLPAYCLHNDIAAGAAAGGAIGALVGGLGGHGRGALIGGLAGTTFGGLSAAQANAQCQQIAVQIAYQQAAAQEAAYEQQMAQRAAQQSGVLSLPAAAYEPLSTNYRTPSNGHRHRVTVRRLNSYSKPVQHEVCDTFTRIDIDLDSNSTSSSTTAHRCKGPDGRWHDV
jgi:hypothetical protein